VGGKYHRVFLFKDANGESGKTVVYMHQVIITEEPGMQCGNQVIPECVKPFGGNFSENLLIDAVVVARFQMGMRGCGIHIKIKFFFQLIDDVFSDCACAYVGGEAFEADDGDFLFQIF
jgi:hypothetical protein